MPVLLFLFDAQHFPAEHVLLFALGTSMAAILFTSLASLSEHHQSRRGQLARSTQHHTRHSARNQHRRIARHIHPNARAGYIFRAVRVFRGCADSGRNAPARYAPIARRSRNDTGRHIYWLVEQHGIHRRRIHRRTLPRLVQCIAQKCDRYFRRHRLSGGGRRHDRLCGHRHEHSFSTRLQPGLCLSARIILDRTGRQSSPHLWAQKPRII